MILRAVEKLIIKTYDRARMFFLHEKNAKAGRIYIGDSTDPYDPRIRRPVYLDHSQHVYVVGASGSGKTKFLEGMIQDDIAMGRGFANLDFHGDASQSVLRHLALQFAANPQDRLVIIKPSDPQYAVGFNPLSASGKTAYGTALELFEIVRRLWGADVLGPRSQEVMRNLFAALVEAGETLDMAEVFLTAPRYRDDILARIQNIEVRYYWQARFAELSERMQASYREPVLNKFSALLADPHILSMVGQQKTRVNFRRIMDESGWLIIELSKGELKANAYLLGAFFLAKLKDAAFSRSNIPEDARRSFSIYADEFQNVATENFIEVLTEARKYKIRFRLAHQHLAQLDRDLRAALFGNVGAILAFAVSHQDAAALAPEIDSKEPKRWEQVLKDLKIGEAVFKPRGERPRVVKIRRMITPSVSEENLRAVVSFSHARYARPKDEVLREIEARRERFAAGFYPGGDTETDLNDRGEGGQSEW